ncbi:MAG: PilN domain-containing protein [Longimicrobiales bacterium]|nr:PilN domain-containing protein [Longimicrobiales bacterium]
MIEVNLIPGGKKKRSSRSFSLSLPSLGGGGGRFDRWLLGAVAAWLVALLYIGMTWQGRTAELEELEVRLETARADSARFAEQSARIATLRARRDSINDRIAIIQEVDQGRYIWAHIMDEIARALPDFTWIEAITATAPEPTPSFLLEGYAGTQFAVSLFLEQLEASPFIERVELRTVDAVDFGQGDAAERVQRYSIDAAYAQPPVELLESVPLFEGGSLPERGGGSTDADSDATSGGV